MLELLVRGIIFLSWTIWECSPVHTRLLKDKSPLYADVSSEGSYSTLHDTCENISHIPNIAKY